MYNVNFDISGQVAVINDSLIQEVPVSPGLFLCKFVIFICL